MTIKKYVLLLYLDTYNMKKAIEARDVEYGVTYTDDTKYPTTFHLVKKNANAVYMVQSGNKKYIESKDGLVGFAYEAMFYIKGEENEQNNGRS